MNDSARVQEYLAEAYRLVSYKQGERYITTSALAEAVGVTAPAVTRMVRRLKDDGYIEHEPYKGIALTPLGEREALLSIRRHRLVERFLVDVMGFGWHEVHDTADDLGAVVSDRIVSRMEELAGYPKRCPHGEPIPTPDGVMPQVIDTALQDVQVGEEYVLSRVYTHDPEMLLYIEHLGLQVGKRFRLVERAPFNGPLQLQIDDVVHHVGHELAGILRVCKPEEFEL